MRHVLAAADLPADYSGFTLRAALGHIPGGDFTFIGGYLYVDSALDVAGMIAALAAYVPPARALVMAYARDPDADVRTIRWDDPSQMGRRLRAIRTEEVYDGHHDLVERWYLADEIERGALGLQPVTGATLLVTYRKRYTDGLVGPTQRVDTVVIATTSGVPITWTLDAKPYDLDESRTLAIRRRTYAARWLQALMSQSVSSGDASTGRTALGQLQPFVESFETTGDASPLLAALQGTAAAMQAVPASQAVGDAMAGALPIVIARLAPWLP